MMIRENIGRNIYWEERNVMIINTTGRMNSMGSGKDSLVFGEDRLEVKMHRGCLNLFNIMELGNNT
jgi:hypothetical protein